MPAATPSAERQRLERRRPPTRRAACRPLWRSARRRRSSPNAASTPAAGTTTPSTVRRGLPLTCRRASCRPPMIAPGRPVRESQYPAVRTAARGSGSRVRRANRRCSAMPGTDRGDVQRQRRPAPQSRMRSPALLPPMVSSAPAWIDSWTQRDERAVRRDREAGHERLVRGGPGHERPLERERDEPQAGKRARLVRAPNEGMCESCHAEGLRGAGSYAFTARITFAGRPLNCRADASWTVKPAAASKLATFAGST